ncbi:effector binding domain-containing protein [Paenibacillus piscarius]|uniref:effector binding domain-containing protein n=1 Tax=Paenibacillus piscarius TaxID=1089681 RepID=UPI001EE9A228|nr:effector binding domain-containing protein [Paenibacillus piscarius]
MISTRIETKAAFRIIGYKTAISEGGAVHDPAYSPLKTAFFKSTLENGSMASLRPLSESPYGFAAIAQEDGEILYIAGVQSSKPQPEAAGEVLFPGGEYLILSGQGGLSRLAFDRLEDKAFGSILNDDYEYVYTGHPIAEVLTNGNPMDAEVEVWVPVKKRDAV